MIERPDLRWEDESGEGDEDWEDEEGLAELDFDDDELDFDEVDLDDALDPEDEDEVDEEDLDWDDLDEDDPDDGDPDDGDPDEDDLDDDDPDSDDFAAWGDDLELDAESPVLTGSVDVFCPYCGADVEVVVDPVGGDEQEYVEDCEVCCQPWAVRVTVDPNGSASVELSTLDES